MPKRSNRRWTGPEVELLFAMIADCKARGVRPEWRKIASAVHHPESSCDLKYHMEKGRLEDEANLAAVRRRSAASAAKPPAAHLVPLKPRIANPDYGQTTSTAKLLMDVELRSRIAVLGITGGLLGDPAPGRSALDEKRRAQP